jgi:hypothetical protein
MRDMENINENRTNAERINYTLRPAKHTERKMLCETFARLSTLDSIKNYRYIGMGSAYFTDFCLFHKAIGITKLLSIESEDEGYQKKRILFNIPYSCIEVKFGLSYDVLPKLPRSKWQNKCIVWLDYVEKLKDKMLGDIDIVIFNLQPGSIFLLTVNIEKEEQIKMGSQERKMTDQEYRIKMLEENVGKENVPLRAYDMNLNVEKNKLIVREIVNNSILNSVKKRNGGLRENDQLMYKQLFNIYYKDSADMLTVGGIIYNEIQESTVNKMFDNLDFIRHEEESFNIIVPKLTFREMHALNKLLPKNEIIKTGIAKKGKLKLPLSKEDVINYANIYRYFPTFTESNL